MTDEKKQRERRALAYKTAGRCHICAEPAPLSNFSERGADGTTVDHLWPRALGGGEELDNKMLAHRGCNSFKGTRPAEEVRLQVRGDDAPPASYEGRVFAAATGVLVGAALAELAQALSRPPTASTPPLDKRSNAHVVFGVLAGGLLGWLLS